MKTTYFRPSIHGWPFVNSFNRAFKYTGISFNMGFCGGMCWKALEKFFAGTPIDRNTKPPKQGSALYNTLYKEQVESLDVSKLAKMFDWQSSPDEGHTFNKHSLGHLTQGEWADVKQSLKFQYPCYIDIDYLF